MENQTKYEKLKNLESFQKAEARLDELLGCGFSIKECNDILKRQEVMYFIKYQVNNDQLYNIIKMLEKISKKKITQQRYEIDKEIIRKAKQANKEQGKGLFEFFKIFKGWIDDPEVCCKNVDEAIELLKFRLL